MVGFCIVALCLLGATSHQHRVDASAKIIGGQMSSVARHPYIVSIRKNGNHMCGGTMLTSKCVLTAAHCVKGAVPGQFSIKAGVTNLAEPGGVSRVGQIFLPAEFNLQSMTHDVAVLTLSTPQWNIQTVELADSPTPANADVMVTGWGRTSEGGTGSQNLQEVTIRTLSNSVCSMRYRQIGRRLTDTMICASGLGKDSCQGDSGGPLMYNNKQIGIVSWGIGCAREQFPGVYTDVLQQKSYIEHLKNRYCKI